jgi:hypothetical protein
MALLLLVLGTWFVVSIPVGIYVGRLLKRRGDALDEIAVVAREALARGGR